MSVRSLNIRCAQTAEGVELAILGDITPYTAEEIMRAVSFFRDQPVTITMMSGGGDAFASLGLYDFLKGKDITVRIYGIAASGAAIISAAAKRVEMAASAFLMIHNAYAVSGEDAGVLDSINERQVALFAAKSGKSKDKVRRMLDAETFMDAQTAKAEGFADSVFDPLKMAASLNTMQPMEEVIKTEAAAEEVKAADITPEVVNADPGDEQPEPKADADAADEVVEVEVPMTVTEAIQAALKGSIKARVNVAAKYGEIVAALTSEVRTLKAQLDEANAQVEALAPKAEAAVAAEQAAQEAAAKVAEVTAEVEKLKSEPLAPAVVADAAPAAQAPGAPAKANIGTISKKAESIARQMDALDRFIGSKNKN